MSAKSLALLGRHASCAPSVAGTKVLRDGGDSMQFDWTALRRASLALALFACGVMGSAWADNPPSRPEATTLADRRAVPARAAAKHLARRQRPSSIAFRRTPPRVKRSSCPGGRSHSRRPQVPFACSTTSASRRPTSHTPPISSMVATAPHAPSRSSSTARLVHRRAGYSSAVPVLGGCRSMPTRSHHRPLRR